MNEGLKYLVETIAIGLNFVFAAAAFLMTLVINAKNRKIDNRLSSLRQILDKEIDLQVDSKRIGRDKVLALMVSIDAVKTVIYFNDTESSAKIGVDLVLKPKFLL